MLRIGAAISLLLAAGGPAFAQCNCVFAEPCTITTNLADFVGGSEHTFCTIRGTAGYWSVAYQLTTPSGRQYRIENPITYFDSWFINGSPGVRVETNDPGQFCYRNNRLQICLGR